MRNMQTELNGFYKTLMQDAEFEALPFTACNPCRSLICEVIKLAIRDSLGLVTINGDTSKELIRRRAWNWIHNPSTATRSFNWYCSLVDLDADCVRRILGRPASRAHRRMVENLTSTQGVYLHKPRMKKDAA